MDKYSSPEHLLWANRPANQYPYNWSEEEISKLISYYAKQQGIAFAEWLPKNDWTTTLSSWINKDTYEIATSEQLFERFLKEQQDAIKVAY